MQAVVFQAFYGMYCFFDEDDEENPERRTVEKIHNYAEEIVPRFADHQFKRHFRMSSTTFENLIFKVYTVANLQISKGRPELGIDKQVMITLWCLGNMESFRSVADRFGITKSSCWAILYRTCQRLQEVNREYNIIAWPSNHKANQIMADFQDICGFPGVIGAIDGCHIRITAPKEYPNSYINRKNYHSVLLQGVCDANKLFTDVYAGQPGSIHDSRLFRKSDLYNRIQNGDVTFPNDSNLIGDLAYTLSTTLMVGFKDNGLLTARKRNFNIKLSKTRAVIENAFALLKGRFRRLKYLETVRLDFIALVIISSCILHNVCITLQDNGEDIINEENVMREERVGENVDDDVHINNVAIVKRNQLCDLLY